MKIKRLNLAIVMGLVISFLLSMTSFDASCTELKDNILRLHIIANSNEAKDQALKLKVRDGILKIGDKYFKTDDTLIIAKEKAKNLLPVFKKEAQKIIKQNGYNYNVDIMLTKSYFNTRHYSDFTLPAGEYDALKVVIGSGKGKNWWCVIFPSICLPSSTTDSLGKNVSENAKNITKNHQKYKIKFKVYEWYESLKNNLLYN